MSVRCFFASILDLVGSQKVTRERMERAQRGMTPDDVIRTVGRPPGDNSSNGCLHRAHGSRYWDYMKWLCDDGELLVRFDNHGLATDIVILDVIVLEPPTVLERLRLLLGLDRPQLKIHG